MWYTDICPPYIRISTKQKHNGPYKGFIRALTRTLDPPTREHKSLLNNAIRLDGVVFVIVFRLVRDVVANHKTTRYAGAATKVIQKNHLA